MARILTGIQSTGRPHVGNLLGAIIPAIKLSEKENNESLFFIADLHSFTTVRDPKILTENTYATAAAWLAFGFNTDKHIFYRQSDVTEVCELTWYLNCFTPYPMLANAHSFKDKSDRLAEVNSGLFTYPVLMAADILAYHATHVPVGEDQKQHLELTRDIAIKFNNDYQVPNFFPNPEPIIEETAPRIMSLRDGSKKMSKSDPSDMSRINLQDDDDLIALKIQKAKTDQEPIPEDVSSLEKRPEANNLVNIYASLASCSPKDVLKEFNGKPFSFFKPKLAEIIISELGPITKKINELMEQPDEIDKVLNDGAIHAREISDPIIKSTYEILGLANNFK